ncbi:MAG: DUF417 family protein, partial [Kordiimonas sp.]
MHQLLTGLMPSSAFARFFAVLSIAIVFVWFGGLNLGGVTDSITGRWVSGHPLLKDVSSANIGYSVLALGGVQVLIGLLIALHAVPGSTKQYAYMGVLIISASALSLMFTNPVWINSLGGFPAIGAGQGIIKYLSIAGLAMWLMGMRHANSVMLLGIILVLAWIGGMKFTAPEADGVYPLLTSSPVFNWWATVYFDKQMASNVIGIIELITVVLLTGWWWNKTACIAGLLLSAATFTITLSFLVSFSGSWSTDFGGFPYLASAG